MLRVAHAEDAGGRIAKKALDIDDLVICNTRDHKPTFFLVDMLVGHLQPAGEFGHSILHTLVHNQIAVGAIGQQDEASFVSHGHAVAVIGFLHGAIFRQPGKGKFEASVVVTWGGSAVLCALGQTGHDCIEGITSEARAVHEFSPLDTERLALVGLEPVPAVMLTKQLQCLPVLCQEQMPVPDIRQTPAIQAQVFHLFQPEVRPVAVSAPLVSFFPTTVLKV